MKTLSEPHNKYRVSPAAERTMDGILFASKKEMQKYAELKLLERAGKIKNLEVQKRFPIVINGIKVFTYVADFVFTEDHQLVVMDVKGFKTPMYRLKKKCVEAAYLIKLTEA